MDNQNNPINPASPNLGNSGAAQPAAPVVPNGVSGDAQAKPVAPAPGTPVENLVQDITPVSKTVEAAPVPAPAPASQSMTNTQPVAPAPVTQPMQAAQSIMNNNYANPAPVAQPYGAPKKSHAGLIVGIVAVLILVIGGIGAFLFYQQHEKTERVLADGLIKLVTAKELATNSVFTVKNDSGKLGDTDLESAKFTLVSSKNDKLESSVNATVELKVHKYDTIKAQAEVMEGENAIYFRIIDTGNISSVVSQAIEDEEMADSVDIKSIIESAFTSIGDSWYEIPYNKIDDSGELKKSVDCVREKVGKLTEGENWNKILSLYQENAFITVKEGATIEKTDGYKKYPLTIDEEKGENFFDALGEEDFMKEIETCTDRDDYGYDYDDYSHDYEWDSDDWDYEVYNDDDDYDYNGGSLKNDIIAEPPVDEDEDKHELNITLGIKPWSHEIVWVGFDGYNESISYSYYGGNSKTKYTFTGDIDIEYTSNVAVPGNTKSVDDLMNSLRSSIEESSKTSYYETYCTEKENYAGYKDEKECKEAVDEAFGEDASSGDLGDLLDNLLL